MLPSTQDTAPAHPQVAPEQAQQAKEQEQDLLPELQQEPQPEEVQESEPEQSSALKSQADLNQPLTPFRHQTMVYMASLMQEEIEVFIYV